MESQAADKRAVAAEEAVRLWQQQASDDSRGSPTPAAESPGLQPATGPAATEEPTAGASPRRTSARPRAKRVAGDGVYRVGKDMEPGTWQSKGNNRCHWERLRGTKSGEPLMVGYGNPFGDAIVTIRSTDDTFKSTNCNDWSRIG
jgi:hypothetical protein